MNQEEWVMVGILGMASALVVGVGVGSAATTNGDVLHVWHDNFSTNSTVNISVELRRVQGDHTSLNDSDGETFKFLRGTLCTINNNQSVQFDSKVQDFCWNGSKDSWSSSTAMELPVWFNFTNDSGSNCGMGSASLICTFENLSTPVDETQAGGGPELAMLQSGMELQVVTKYVGEDGLGNDRGPFFASWDGHVTLRAGSDVGENDTVPPEPDTSTESAFGNDTLDTFDHALQNFTEPQTNSLLFWGGTTLFGMVFGLPLVALVSTFAVIGVIVEGAWPVETTFGVTLLIFALWAEFIARRFRLRERIRGVLG